MKLPVKILIAALFLPACSPEPVLRLHTDHTEEERIMVYQGMEYLISEKEHSTAILSYYRHIGDRIVMDLEVFNDSEEPIRFEPSELEYKAYRLPRTWDENPEEHEGREVAIARKNAHDPETILLNIDKETSRSLARNRTNILLEGITSGLATATELAQAGGDTSYSGQEARRQNRERRAMQRTARRDNHYCYIAGLNERRTYWETETLRTTDLIPGESVAGEISFPVTENAGMIDIFVEIGGETHTFRYRQRSYGP
jgi:hypothetical protein